MRNQDDAPRLLIVDDEPTNLKVLHQILQADYRLSFAKSGEQALALVEREPIQLILLDVMMPGLTGFAVCKRLKENPATAHIPVIFVTALKDSVDEAKGFSLGAVDYLTKPVTPVIVQARVKTHLSLVKVEELKRTHQELIDRLGRAAEYKDNETGMHTIRMSHFSKLLARARGLPENAAEMIRLAAPMHDLGKIGIPDRILQKAGPLTEPELKIMREHAYIGAEILDNSDSPLIQLACQIALEHHEKWDGSGYPAGLCGEEISLEARIVTVADVFDALTSRRPYKDAWPVEKAMEYMLGQSGKHFDPGLIDLLEDLVPEFMEIRDLYSDDVTANAGAGKVITG